MKRKIIFLDIDGTLTQPGSNEPPESAVWAIAQARKAGHYVFLCTGRNYGMLSPLLQYGFDGVVASSGGYIEWQGRCIYDCPMTPQQKQAVMDVLAKNGVFRTIECREGSYTDEGLKEFLRSHEKEGSNSELLRWREQIEKSLNILPMKQYGGQPVYKIVIVSRSSEHLKEPRQVLSEDFSFCIQEENMGGMINGEVVNKKFDKGRAIERVSRELHIPLCDTVAFGDSMNDKEMIETAGLGICMENGSEAVKKLADAMCPSVADHGIRQAFIKYKLIS